MKYRNKSLTRIQKIMRKFPRTVQRIYSFAGITVKKREPRWRQIEKVRAKYEQKTKSIERTV